MMNHKNSSKVDYVTFNDDTRKTIIRTFAEENGILPNTAQTFDNVDDAIKYLFHPHEN